MISDNLPAILFISFSVSLLSIFILRQFAEKLNLVDAPDGRKLHSGYVPMVGGISIFLGVAAAFFYFPASEQEIVAFLAAAIVIVLIGLIDDRSDLKVRYRLISQLVAALIITLGSGATIQSLGEFGSNDYFELGKFSLPFTIFSIMVAINAFNFVDGIDGLSGLLFIIAMLAMIALCRSSSGAGIENYIVPLIFLMAVVPYMVFNLGLLGKSNRIFLGDAGSMLLGLTVAWLLIRYTQGKMVTFSPVTGLWIIALPLMDMLAVVIRRTLSGNTPFRPDRNHLHHLFVDRGYSDRLALLIIGGIAIIFAVIGVLSERYNVSNSFMLITFLIIFFIYYRLMSHFETQKILSECST